MHCWVFHQKKTKMCRVYSCIVLLLCISFGLAKVDITTFPDDLQKLIHTLHKTCVDQTGVPEGDVEKMQEGTFVENEEIKCYAKCVMTESGVLDDKGDIDFEALSEVVPEYMKEPTKRDFETCSKREGKIDDCEKAYATIKCVQELDPDNFFFP